MASKSSIHPRQMLRAPTCQREPKSINRLKFLLIIYLDGGFLLSGGFSTRILPELQKRLLLLKDCRLVRIRQPDLHLPARLPPQRSTPNCHSANHQPRYAPRFQSCFSVSSLRILRELCVCA
jgi:hypothetical protein